MNPELLLQKLLAAGRAAAPSEHVPYAFEKGVMARIGGRVPDFWTAWGSVLWRAVAPCAAIMLAVGLGSLTLAASDPAEDLGERLDTVLLAGLDTTDFQP